MKKTCSTCGEVKEESEFRKGRNQCKACEKAYREANAEKIKAYRAANTEKVKVYRKAYYDANAEKEKARQKAYREANAEKVKAYDNAYREANPEKVKAKNKAYREANPEKCRAHNKAYYEANPEKYRTYDRNRRARERNASGTHTAQDIRFLLNLQRNSCACCGTRFPDKGKNRFHVDHIIPLAHDSLTPYNSVDNLQLLCPSCNLQKHTEVVDYRSKREKRKVSEYLQQSLL